MTHTKLLEERIIEDTKSLTIKVRNGLEMQMVAYREMLYGISRNNEDAKSAYSNALKRNIVN